MRNIKGIIAVILMMVFFLPGLTHADADEAEDITSKSEIVISDGQSSNTITDKEQSTYISLAGDSSVTVSNESGIAGIYIIWERIPVEWDIVFEGQTYACGKNGFLHEFISIKEISDLFLTNQFTIHIPESGAKICEIYVFSEGELPVWVQIWQPPCDKADLLLLPTHADDEQLFFAGILPYYAGEIGAKVQVVYLTNHWDTSSRPHEQLNGLWTVGVTAYPVIGAFPDLYSMSLDGVVTGFEAQGYKEEDFTAFHAEMIRRFKPQVVVGHDIDGEYGHGAHILNTYTYRKAVEISGDETQFPESATKFGVWDVPKTYLHLWKENTVIMDWDKPLAHFGGKTAFQVSQEGFLCHKSQLWTWFMTWMTGTDTQKITLASQQTQYSCREYGLYRTTTGNDTGLNDFFENITLYQDEIPVTPSPSPEPTPEQTLIPESSPSPEIKDPPDTNHNGYIVVYVIITSLLSCIIGIFIYKIKNKTK